MPRYAEIRITGTAGLRLSGELGTALSVTTIIMFVKCG